MTFEMQSPELGALLEALAKAQAIMHGALKDSANPFFKSTYADLTSVWDACREPLSSNGLSVVQTVQLINEKLCLVSILGHKSGQWIKSVLPITPSKQDIQALGAAITYCRRFSLSSLVGVCPEDDDGESTLTKEEKKIREERQHKKAPPSDFDPSHFEEAALTLSFPIPKDIHTGNLERFIVVCMDGKPEKRNAVIRGANQRPKDFLDAYRDWSLTNPPPLH